MEEGLFRKYATQIHKRKTTKKELLFFIKANTGISLKEEEVELLKNQIKISTSSAVKQKLFQKNITTLLQEKGFILRG